jgi:hypothetical protein
MSPPGHSPWDITGAPARPAIPGMSVTRLGPLIGCRTAGRGAARSPRSATLRGESAILAGAQALDRRSRMNEA